MILRTITAPLLGSKSQHLRELVLVAVEQRVRVKCSLDAVAKCFQRALGVGIRTGNGFEDQKRATAFDDFGGTEQGKFFLQLHEIGSVNETSFLEILGRFLRLVTRCGNFHSRTSCLGSPWKSQLFRRYTLMAEVCTGHEQNEVIILNEASQALWPLPTGRGQPLPVHAKSTNLDMHEQGACTSEHVHANIVLFLASSLLESDPFTSMTPPQERI